MSISLDSPLPSSYRSRQDFLASLPPWRRLLSKLNWHPTIELKVQQYELEQRMIEREKREQQLRKEDERLAELDAKIAALWPSSSSSSAPAPPPERDSPT